MWVLYSQLPIMSFRKLYQLPLGGRQVKACSGHPTILRHTNPTTITAVIFRLDQHRQAAIRFMSLFLLQSDNLAAHHANLASENRSIVNRQRCREHCTQACEPDAAASQPILLSKLA